jgi:uncharacterized protein (TIGR02646 family)
VIRVDRSAIASPPSLEDPLARPAREAAKAFYGTPFKERSQRVHTFDAEVYAAEDVRLALRELFSRKCAYCETPVGDRGEIDHFRPRFGALNADGAFSPDHYWWLAYEWENLYLACAMCARVKGPRFPVGARRARPTAQGEALMSEQAFLLDPCLDEPGEHLLFDAEGRVAAKDARGETTIEILNLNREELVRWRREAVEEARRSWNAVLKSGDQPAYVALFDATVPFAGIRRQFASEWAKPADVEPPTDEVIPAPVPTREKQRIKRDFDARQQAKEAYSVVHEDREAREAYFSHARLVERVVVRNLRIIDELDLDLSSPAGERGPWLMLLGENGTGKSSVLQAVALALMGDAYRSAVPVDPADLVRRGARSGTIEVYLTGSSAPITLRFSRQGFRSNTPEPKVLLLGYGATRLLPRGLARRQELSEYAQVDNLFDPFVPLRDATSWLLSLKPQVFDVVARSLKRLLVLGEDETIRRNTRLKRIEVDIARTRVPLEHLSDGYQSIVAVAADIMSVLLRRWPAMEVAEGIVVMDELGAHLHPRWRMLITERLRETFPRLQFLVSTHDPLCLRGLEDGEAVVLRRVGVSVDALTDLPPVKGLRVDQLLTSEHFGLRTTVDPSLELLFDRYYELLAKRRPTKAERLELESLRPQLEPYRVLGSTPREQLILEAADEFLAGEPELTDGGDRLNLREDTKRKIAAVWAGTDPSEVG